MHVDLIVLSREIAELGWVIVKSCHLWRWCMFNGFFCRFLDF